MIDSNLDVLPVTVARTLNGQTTTQLMGYPHAKTTCGVPPSGLDIYNADPLRNTKLVPIELAPGKVLKAIVCSSDAVVDYLGVWDYHDGGISVLANAASGLGLRLRTTRQNVANAVPQTTLMKNEAGGYPFPSLYSGTKAYATLLSGFVTGTYLFEILNTTGTVLKSTTKDISVSTNGNNNNPPAQTNVADLAENRTSGTLNSIETLTDMNGTPAKNSQIIL